MLIRVVVVLTSQGHRYFSVGVMWQLYASFCLTGSATSDSRKNRLAPTATWVAVSPGKQSKPRLLSRVKRVLQIANYGT
jgi:hypothetical protein